MELRRLRYFVAVAEQRHFGRTAERLGIARPPLSQQIRSLERELGTQLLHRIPGRIELAKPGEALLEDARWILARADPAIRNVERAGRGELDKLCVGFTFAASSRCAGSPLTSPPPSGAAHSCDTPHRCERAREENGI
jgi:DNA-binding transcriptional LysR family regulator